ncbi:MAG: RluA family pseudouridine synthase [Candidatus Eisenbacteria bacterium]|nr:RluA family pseudouridine synthase [Candidatus Eisenbacteria bacterium]
MDEPRERSEEIRVSAVEAGRRIDVLLRERFPGVGRARWKEEIAAGRVLRNDRPVRKGEIAREGDRIFLVPPDAVPSIAPDPEGPLTVLYEDEASLVVEKEAGLPTLPRNGRDRGALACRVAARYPETATVGRPLEAGLVHRLDTGTSGLLVAARTETAYVLLRDQWRARRVRKEYLALAEGRIVRPFTADAPIGHHPGSARRMIAGAGGRAAETRFEPLYAASGRTLLWAELREGRRHQIRVHLAAAGHPVAGDPLYGSGGGGRMMLHAARVRFISPAGDGVSVNAISDPPADFRERLAAEAGEEAFEFMESRLEAVRRER